MAILSMNSKLYVVACSTNNNVTGTNEYMEVTDKDIISRLDLLNGTDTKDDGHDELEYSMKRLPTFFNELTTPRLNGAAIDLGSLVEGEELSMIDISDIHYGTQFNGAIGNTSDSTIVKRGNLQYRTTPYDVYDPKGVTDGTDYFYEVQMFQTGDNYDRGRYDPYFYTEGPEDESLFITGHVDGTDHLSDFYGFEVDYKYGRDVMFFTDKLPGAYKEKNLPSASPGYDVDHLFSDGRTRFKAVI